MRPFERLSRQTRSQTVRIANREVETRGLSTGLWTDDIDPVVERAEKIIYF